MASSFIGVMSGTSLDGIDAGLFSFEQQQCQTLDTVSIDFPPALRAQLLSFARGGALSALQIGEMTHTLSALYADSVLTLKQRNPQHDIVACGCHGQTVWHQPNGEKPFSWQLGNPHQIAVDADITVVADFRQRDVAQGGQGAPLAPLFHHWLWPSRDSAVINIGGIANLSSPESGAGYDTGPGNTLMDAWAQRHINKAFDENGDWAASGKVEQPLLQQLLADEYFKQPPPKSTGPEYFNLQEIEKLTVGMAENDVQATLLELTAHSIADQIKDLAITKVVICGGGAYNKQLLKRLAALSGKKIETSDSQGLDPQWVEAATFAWLAKQAIEKQQHDTSALTGATAPVRLGVIYPA